MTTLDFVATGITLSICTPSYNYAHFIGDSLASVALQDDKRVEHVVVDHGADGTVDLLRESDYPRLVWSYASTVGLSETLNACIDASSGEWVGFLNADDYYLPNTFDSVLRVIDEEPEVDFIFGDSVDVDSAGNLLRLSAQHGLNRRVLRWWGSGMAFCGIFVRKSALPAFDSNIKKAQDWDMPLALFERGCTFRYLRGPLGAARRHESQDSVVGSDWSEMRYLRRRHGLTPDPRAAALARLAGLAEHRARKMVVGSYLRELRVRPFIGVDTRWFASDAAFRSTRAMVERASRLAVRE